MLDQTLHHTRSGTVMLKRPVAPGAKVWSQHFHARDHALSASSYYFELVDLIAAGRCLIEVITAIIWCCHGVDG